MHEVFNRNYFCTGNFWPLNCNRCTLSFFSKLHGNINQTNSACSWNCFNCMPTLSGLCYSILPKTGFYKSLTKTIDMTVQLPPQPRRSNLPVPICSGIDSVDKVSCFRTQHSGQVRQLNINPLIEKLTHQPLGHRAPRISWHLLAEFWWLIATFNRPRNRYSQQPFKKLSKMLQMVKIVWDAIYPYELAPCCMN